jgi:carnitine O-octanoyltransferase
VINAIHRGINLFYQLADDVELVVMNLHQCTKEDIKQYVRIHPDTFFQLCLQLAYFKIHDHKPAPTYETAATRQFYRGRTETARTCSIEAVAWCRAMTNQSTV